VETTSIKVKPQLAQHACPHTLQVARDTLRLKGRKIKEASVFITNPSLLEDIEVRRDARCPPYGALLLGTRHMAPTMQTRHCRGSYPPCMQPVMGSSPNWPPSWAAGHWRKVAVTDEHVVVASSTQLAGIGHLCSVILLWFEKALCHRAPARSWGPLQVQMARIPGTAGVASCSSWECNSAGAGWARGVGAAASCAHSARRGCSIMLEASRGPCF